VPGTRGAEEVGEGAVRLAAPRSVPSARLRLSCFTAAAFAVLGVYLPFWPAWLASRGLSIEQIGTLTMAGAWVRGLSLPAWAHFADRSGRRKPWVVALAALSVLAFVPFGFAGSFAALLGLTLAFSAFHAAVHPLGENLTVLLAREKTLSYGSVRVWGSLAFLVVSTAAGVALDGGRERVAFALVLGGLVLTALAALALPDLVAPPPPRASRAPLREVLVERPIVAVLLGSGVLQASHAMYYVYGTLHWSAAGHSKSTIGMLWAEGVVAEVVLLFAAGPLLRRFRDESLMALAIAGGTVRWAALGLSADLAVLAGTQWLHALSFAAAHLATMGFLARAVVPERSATATSLYGMFNIAAHALTILAITPVFDAHGGAAFFPMIALAALGGSLAIAGMRRAA
jgi:PPP family 3-phenylpropionic acid transporter